MPTLRNVAATAALLLAAATPAVAGGDGVLHRASPGDPYANCPVQPAAGTLYPGAEVEPYVSVDPRDPRRAVTVFQQDRYAHGGAKGIVASWTKDGSTFHETTLPFDRCAPGGANYALASDPWVSTGPDGTVYASGGGGDTDRVRNAVLAVTSYDGGRTWHHLTPTIQDAQDGVFNDKPSLTADPTCPGTAYQVWDRTTTGDDGSFDGPGYIAVTRNGGRTWSAARPFVPTRSVPHSQTLGHVIVVDRHDGTLYDFFTWLTYDAALEQITNAHFAVVTSHDHGRTWSSPRFVARDTSVDPTDPNAPDKPLRTAVHLPSPAVDPRTGVPYLTYEGSDFSNGAFNQVELVRSDDHGRTWSAPRLISPARVPAFSPAATVTRRGTLAVLYYDLRYLRDQKDTLPTAYWLAALPDGRTAHRSEHRIGRIFDWLQAPFAGGYFLGDYQGLAPSADGRVRPVATLTHDDRPDNRTDEYSGTFRVR